MQNNSLVKIFGFLFLIVSIYQLSFTFISSGLEENAKDYAYSKISEEEVDYISKREKLESQYLDSIANISIYGFIFIILIYLMRGIITPNLRNHININSTSERRATVLSLRSFVIRISFALIAPILGYITDVYEISYVFYFLGLLVGISSLLAVYKLKINN